MNGHRQVIAQRRDGYRPSAVFVTLVDEPIQVTNRFDEPENALRNGLYPQIEVARRDLRSTLDLRFLVGLEVHVHAQAMDDDMGLLLDLIEAEQPEKLVACAGDALLFLNQGAWQAWTF